MDKYEERVSKILEKKKIYDSEKNRKRKNLVQCISIALVCAISVAAFVVIPKRASIINVPETSTSALSEADSSGYLSETTSDVLSVETHSETVGSTKKQTQFFTQQSPSEPTNIHNHEKPDDTGNEEFCPPSDGGGIGGDSGDYIDPYTTKYRRIYYDNISVFFAVLVDRDELYEWSTEYYAKNPNADGLFEKGEEITEPKTMRIVDFIKHFNIPKEEFEEANKTWCHRMIKWGDVPVMNPKDYKEQEEFEVYNVDIIYTFDDEIINAYYERGEYPFDTEEEYLEAIENDGYITQTEEFIMLEGFEKVTLPALPPDAKPIYIDFDWRAKKCK